MEVYVCVKVIKFLKCTQCHKPEDHSLTSSPQWEPGISDSYDFLAFILSVVGNEACEALFFFNTYYKLQNSYNKVMNLNVDFPVFLNPWQI